MQKENFLEVGQSVAGFEIIDPARAPEGMTGQLLWDLWDIGVKFGSYFEKGIGFSASPLILKLYDFRGNGTGGTVGFTVGKSRPSQLMEEGASLFQLKNGINVVWDNGFSVDDILKVIKKIDDFALSEGWIVGEQRIPIIDKSPPQTNKMTVQIFLNRPGTVMPVFPGIDIEQALNDFDRPDLLGVIDFGGMKLICLKNEKDKMVEEYKVKMKRLKEMGITAENIGDMSYDEIMELKKTLE